MSASPFFVVGTGRSGTTLFRKLLCFHPEVHIPKETHWLPVLWNEFGDRTIPTSDIQAVVDRVYMAKGRTAFERIARQADLPPDRLHANVATRTGSQTTVADWHAALLGELASVLGAKRSGDKTPDYGFAMDTILRLFPTARFVHVVRDGRDVALSMSKVLSFRILAGLGLTHWWSVALDRGYERGLPAAADEIPIDRFLELWHRRVMRIRDEASRLPTDRFLEVSYESVLTDSRGTLERTREFLELDANEGWLDAARAFVRSDNLGRNDEDPVRRRLGVDHADLLVDAGFAT